MKTSTGRSLALQPAHSLAGPGSTGRDETTRRVIAVGLERARAPLARDGMEVPSPRGQLLRPRVAYHLIPEGLRATLPEEFWLGCLAIQMVHEASLLHDDVVDGGSERRGRETVSSRSGPGQALLLGDAYLTGAYVAADLAGSPGFLTTFIQAVERTVRGERQQAHGMGRETYSLQALEGKTGALFGAASVLASQFGSPASRSAAWQLGVDLGVFYQRVDDFLDYCPRAQTGKPSLQDFRRRLPTWVVPPEEPGWFDRSEADVVRRFIGIPGGDDAPAARAVRSLEADCRKLEDALAEVSPDACLPALLRALLSRCRSELERERRAPAGLVALPRLPATVERRVGAGRAVGM